MTIERDELIAELKKAKVKIDDIDKFKPSPAERDVMEQLIKKIGATAEGPVKLIRVGPKNDLV